jgi:hypothetical protein
MHIIISDSWRTPILNEQSQDGNSCVVIFESDT